MVYNFRERRRDLNDACNKLFRRQTRKPKVSERSFSIKMEEKLEIIKFSFIFYYLFFKQCYRHNNFITKLKWQDVTCKGQNLWPNPVGMKLGQERGPIQLICRGGWSRSTFFAQVVSVQQFKERKLARTTVLVKDCNKGKKIFYSSSSSSWSRRGGSFNTQSLVIQ